MLLEISTLNVEGKPFNQIITAGGRYSYALTDTTLFRAGQPSLNSFWQRNGLIFPRNGVMHGDDTYFAFAIPDAKAHSLSYFPYANNHRGFNLANHDTVTCIYHPPLTNLVIVGLECGLKVFTFDPSKKLFTHLRTCKFNFTPAEINAEFLEGPISVPKLHIRSSDETFHTIIFPDDSSYRIEPSSDYLGLAGWRTNQGEFFIGSSINNGQIRWRNNDTNGAWVIFNLEEEILQAEIPRNPRFKHLGVLLLGSRKILIADTSKSTSEWISLNEHEFSAMALADKTDKPPAVLLASGHQLFQYELTL